MVRVGDQCWGSRSGEGQGEGVKVRGGSWAREAVGFTGGGDKKRMFLSRT